MNGECRQNGIKKPKPLTRSCSENYEINEVDVPGTPKTPRTSQTPGSFLFLRILFGGFNS